MQANPSSTELHGLGAGLETPARAVRLLLAVDTCGPAGSVALGRLDGQGLDGQRLEILGQVELEGRTYSTTLVAAVRDLLAAAGATVRELACIVAVNGPGSFTGVRLGLSAVKGLAEPADTPVVALSRLEVLAWKAGTACAALDAHRHEIFLRLGAMGGEAGELLAGAAELAAMTPVRLGIAVCDDAAEAVLRSAWDGAELVPMAAPTASDALDVAIPQILAWKFADLMLLDGHYLRRSDAEIFGEPAGRPARGA